MRGWHAESVAANFVIYLLILLNCDRARTQPEIGRRDGLAKFVPGQGTHNGSIGPPDTLHVFNFAKLYETLYAQLMHSASPPADRHHQHHPPHPHHGRQGRGLRKPQAQLLWAAERPVTSSTAKPFNVLQQLQLELDEQLKQQQATTEKPFSVLEQLTLEQMKLLQKQRPNISFDLIHALQLEQEKLHSEASTEKPFDLFEQLDHELDKHDKQQQQQQQQQQEQQQPGGSTFEVLQPVAGEPLEQHKSASKAPTESSRATDSQKRRRKRIRRRRKRIRRRRKRKRRRGKKKRKRKRKKKQKKRLKKGKKGKKKRKNKKRRKPMEHEPVIGQEAQVIFANPTKQPYYPHHHPGYPHAPEQPQQPPPPMMPATALLQLVTTKKPATTKAPFSKIKYLLRHNSLFKKKKKEWFNHVGHVLYPFIKFVAFFTVLNPFTLGVFLFTLISPVVFGFFGFVALSVLVKPFLNLVFGVKANVDNIDRRRYLANKRAEQLKLNLRPVTIHKHYYQQKPLHSTPPRQYRPVVDWRRQAAQPEPAPARPPPRPIERRHNPLLPTERAALERSEFPFL